MLTWGICQNEDLKSAVVVVLPHDSLKILPHQGRLNFWLTVLTGISDPELVFGFHSSHVVMCVLIHWRPKDFTLADKGAEEDAIGFAKNVSRFSMRVQKYLAAHRCGSAFPENGLAFRPDLGQVGKTLVDW